MKRRTPTHTSPSPFRCLLTPERVSRMNRAQNVLDRHHGREPLIPSYDLFLLRYAEEDRTDVEERPTLEVVRPYKGTIYDKGLTLKWPVLFGREH